MDHRTLTFHIRTKDTLNSNRMPRHPMVKSKMASHLRTLGSTEGLAQHPNPDLARSRHGQILDAADLAATKARITKAKNKAQAPQDEIDDSIARAIRDFTPRNSQVSPVQVPPIFQHYRIQVTVLAPTRRRLDPPNFYPTVKALVDGLTDASWWPDDDWAHLVETSFRYGGLSGQKDIYTLILDIQEVDPDQYITQGELLHPSLTQN